MSFSASPQLAERWREMSRVAHATLAITAAGTVLLVALSLALFTLPAIGSVSPQALTYSLTREAGGDLWSTDIYKCKRRSQSTYGCEVGETDGGSGVASFRLQARGRRCWRAVKTSPDSREDLTPMARRLRGCATWRDQVRFVERLLSL